MIQDKLHADLLLDFYENLLTSRQLEILELYLRKDYSMNEIAETLNISKAGVSDLIKRSYKQLIEYESKLNCLEKYTIRNELYQQLASLKIDKINDIVLKLKESE